jgi:queuine tRNA-ribosyltransferase
MSREDSPFRIIPCLDGSHTLHDERVGHGMHSHVGPDEESRRIYVEASRLTERLREPATERLRAADPEPLVLWDVGMGIAANALAALDCRRALARANPAAVLRPLRIASFESDLRGLRLALDAPAEFPLLTPHRDALETLLDERRWSEPGCEWTLHEGDFAANFRDAPVPELVYWDFYSPPSCPALWSVGNFARVVEAARPRSELGLPTHLFTYSAATPVRAAMLLAGLYVGLGSRTSMKTESTEASTVPGFLAAPLGASWLAKWDRSSRRRPWTAPGTPAPDERELRARLAERIAGNR